MIEALWQTLGYLGLDLLLGRLVLSFLPPGEPGGHAPGKLPATLAASLVLGLLVLVALSFVAEDPWALALGLGTGGWLLRWATSPGGIVPRHELPPERWSWLARLAYLAAFAPALLPLPHPEAQLGEPLDFYLWEMMQRTAWVLLLVVVEHGLATARRAPLGRAVFVLALSAFLFVQNPHPGSWDELVERIGAASFCAGAAFALGWLRRADQRSALLAVACFVLGRTWYSLDGVVVVAVALYALAFFTPQPSRAWIAIACLIGFLVCIAPDLSGLKAVSPTHSGSALPEFLRLALVLAVLATAAWIARSIAARRQPEAPESRDALARGDQLLLVLILVAGVVGSRHGVTGLQLVAPVAFLLAGCVSIRPERAV